MKINDAIIQAIDPEEFAIEYLGAEKIGEKIRCINPNHADNDPSMVRNDHGKPHLHCWGCDSHPNRKSRWDIFDLASLFLKKEKKAHGFKDALVWLADKIGVEVQLNKKQTRLEEFWKLCEAETREMLFNNKHKQVFQYLSRRKITSRDVIETIGVAPSLGRSRPFGKDVSNWYEPLAKEGAIVFPIVDSKGKLIAVKIRLARLSPEGEIDKEIKTIGKGEGFFGNTNKGRCLVVEGEIDALHLMQLFGVDSVKGCNGASSSMREIHNLGADLYTIIPDNDPIDPKTGLTVGHGIAHKLAMLGSHVTVACLPREYKDLEDFTTRKGVDETIDYISNNIKSYGRFLADWRFKECLKELPIIPGREYHETTWRLAMDLSNVSDRSDFIKSASLISGVPYDEILEKLKPSAEHTKSKMQEEIAAIRRSELPKSEEYMLIAMECFDHFSDQGMWLRDGTVPYLVWEGEPLAVLLSDRGAMFQALLYREAGIVPVTSEGKHVISAIRMQALCEAKQMRYESVNFCDRRSKTIYVCLNEGTAIKIDPYGIKKCSNGMDGVFLTWMDYYKPIDFNPNADKVSAIKFIKEQLLDRMACEPSLRPFIVGFFLSSYVREFVHGQKCLLHITGGQGAGKTSAMGLVNFLLFGSTLNRGMITDAALRSGSGIDPVMLLDNWEHQNITKERIQFLLTSATGSSALKRKQNTERGLTSEALNTLCVITSIETWGNLELQSRKINIHFDKKWRENKDMVTLSSLEDIVASNRNEVLSGLFRFFSEDLIPAISSGEKDLIQKEWLKLPSEKPLDKDRVLPMIALIHFIVKKMTDVYSDFCMPSNELFESWKEYLYKTDASDRIESNPFFNYIDSLSILKGRQGDLSLKYNSSDNSWTGSAFEFLSAFNLIDKIQGNKERFPYSTPGSLGSRARKAQADLTLGGYTFKQIGQHPTLRVKIWKAQAPEDS